MTASNLSRFGITELEARRAQINGEIKDAEKWGDAELRGKLIATLAQYDAEIRRQRGAQTQPIKLDDQ